MNRVDVLDLVVDLVDVDIEFDLVDVDLDVDLVDYYFGRNGEGTRSNGEEHDVQTHRLFGCIFARLLA